MNTLSVAHFNVLYPEMVLSQFVISPVPDEEVRAYATQFAWNPFKRLPPNAASTWASYTAFELYHSPVISSRLLIGSCATHLQDEDVIAGRQEIFECWTKGFADPDNVDEVAVQDAVYGTLQLGFNNIDSPLVSAYVPLFNENL